MLLCGLRVAKCSGLVSIVTTVEQIPDSGVKIKMVVSLRSLILRARMLLNQRNPIKLSDRREAIVPDSLSFYLLRRGSARVSVCYS